MRSMKREGKLTGTIFIISGVVVLMFVDLRIAIGVILCFMGHIVWKGIHEGN